MGSRQGKIVAKSKMSEWKGLDRISIKVHEMKCIWREQEKDDIGIDGEIELCKPRVDAEGMIGTGKIIKVQSKSGQRYVVKDTVSSFSSPVEEKDLRYWHGLNVPAVYIVYHPEDDCLYWKHVQAFIDNTDDALSPPFRINFDKTQDRFDQTAYQGLCGLCEISPERVQLDKGEDLYTNILPVLSMPEEIWVAPVLPEKQSRFHERLSGDQRIPPYSFSSGMLVTLADPTIEGTAITNVVDYGAVESFSLDDWLSQDTANENVLRALLNSTLHRKLRYVGLTFLRSHRRYFYNEGLTEDSPIEKHWTSSRTERSQSRTVAKYFEYGKNKFFRHLSLDARFERFGDSWGVIIEPKLHFSKDGLERWEGKAARSYAIKARSEQYNNVFLNDVLFWAFQLSEGDKEFDLIIGRESVAVISGVPLKTLASFSIDSVTPPDRKVQK